MAWRRRGDEPGAAGADAAEVAEGTNSAEARTTPLDALANEADAANTETTETVTSSRTTGWMRVIRGNRSLWVTALVAAVSLAAGLLLGKLVLGPSSSAAEPPEAGLITVPVEQRALSNDVVLRGDIAFADSVDVRIASGDLAGAAVVTGQVPEVGATLDARAIALEVAGRPLIVLPGDVPAYRTLSVGLQGPDVVQLKAALTALGIPAGDPASDVYDAATASGVQSLYQQIGYQLPQAPEGTGDEVRLAESSLADAESAITQAQVALRTAQAGPTGAQRLEQDNLVNSALRAFQAAQSAGADPVEVANLSDAYQLALAQRSEALRAPNVQAEQSAVNQAIQQRDSAARALEEARTAAMPFLPASEVLYLSDLPRRVDEVLTQRGATLEGVAMRVSGATLEVTANATDSDAALLAVGDTATFELPDGSEATATISEIGGTAGADSGSGGNGDGNGSEGDGNGESQNSDRVPIAFTLPELAPEVVAALRGENVRLAISVESTAGDVMAVPLAALTAGAGGESRVEVVVDGDEGETELVEVTTGLAAEGFVEVSAPDGALEIGDLVVVGR